jgi:YD repeat-containing protein
VLFTYDALGNPLTMTQPGGGRVVMTYDDVGNLLTMTDPLGT